MLSKECGEEHQQMSNNDFKLIFISKAIENKNPYLCVTQPTLKLKLSKHMSKYKLLHICWER